MAIPNIQPPPNWSPQGWTPNSLKPTAAQTQAQAWAMTLAQATAVANVNGIGLARSAVLSLTNAQVLTFSSVPVPFPDIPATAGFFYVPWYLFGHLDSHLGAWTQARSIQCKYVTGGPSVDLIAPNQTTPNTAIERIFGEPIQTSIAFSSTLNNPLSAAQSPVNWGLQMTASGDNAAGNAANFARFFILFQVIKAF